MPDINLSEETLPRLFWARHAILSHRACLQHIHHDGTTSSLSWVEVAHRSAAIAAHLIQLGIEPGDRVAILSQNRPEWSIADLGIMQARAITVPLYPSEGVSTMVSILADAGARCLFVGTEAQLRTILEVRDRLPELEHLCVIDATAAVDALPVGTGVWMDWLDHESAELQRIQEHEHAATSGDIATLIYTSGTTGEPKGVMLSHENLLSNCAAVAKVLPITDRDIHLSILPLSHVFERMAGLFLMLQQGATIVYGRGFDAISEDMHLVQPTIIIGVPRMYEKAYANIRSRVAQAPAIRQRLFSWAIDVGHSLHGRGPARTPSVLARWFAQRLVWRKIHQGFGGRVRFAVSGGAPLSAPIGEFFEACGFLILEGYGLTETSPVITVNRLDAYRFGTVGSAIPGVDVRIEDDGEIFTRGPHVSQGYFNRPEATAESFRDGWFATGDIGVLEEDGMLRITDRKKALIVTAGGKNVAPQKLERLLLCDPWIVNIFIYGDRRKYLTALIVPDFDVLASWAATHGCGADDVVTLVRQELVIAECRARIDRLSADLASYEQIKYFCLMDHPWTQEDGHLTPTLKVRGQVILERYGSQIEEMYPAEHGTPSQPPRRSSDDTGASQ